MENLTWGLIPRGLPDSHHGGICINSDCLCQELMGYDAVSIFTVPGTVQLIFIFKNNGL